MALFSETYRVRIPKWDASVPDFEVFAAAYDAPVIINLCNIKRHFIAGYSCALKNNVGAVPGSGATSTRDRLHNGGAFTDDLVAIAQFVNPDLNIVDAQSILTRNGPFVSTGVTVAANRLVLRATTWSRPMSTAPAF